MGQMSCSIGPVLQKSNFQGLRGGEMKKDEIRKVLLNDISHFRLKEKYYESLRLFEAASYAGSLASNLELALTTMPSDDDTEIA